MSRIEQISSKSREQILSRLSSAHQIDDAPVAKNSDPVPHIVSFGDPLSEMKQKMSDNKYIVEEVADASELESKINEIAALYGYDSFIYPDGLGLDIDKINASKKVCFNKPIEELRSEVFSSDFSVVSAHVGVSSHGVALVLSSPNQPRMLSLSPKLCIVLLKKERVVKSISEALNMVKGEYSELPSNLLFIAGPSRTADIELITVFGVHGPQKAHIIVY